MYEYQDSRRVECVRNFLSGFHEILECDGYQAYGTLEDVILVCCLAHVRRKFFEAIPAARRKKLKLLDINSEIAIEDVKLPEDEDLKKLNPAEIGLLYCNKLFFIERTLKGLDPDKRKERREVKEKPVWDSFSGKGK